ncbi:MAG: anti-virulence regulator CigR family protein, partial [Gemmatimonadota bacterium]
FLLVTTPVDAFAQGRGNRAPAPSIVSITLSPDIRVQIQQFYSSRAASGAEALPPGIRRRLARGKELPPGIAKKNVPTGLRSRIELPVGFEIVEVGLDVLLVEVATDIVRDVLMDIVR